MNKSSFIILLLVSSLVLTANAKVHAHRKMSSEESKSNGSSSSNNSEEGKSNGSSSSNSSEETKSTGNPQHDCSAYNTTIDTIAARMTSQNCNVTGTDLARVNTHPVQTLIGLVNPDPVLSSSSSCSDLTLLMLRANENRIVRRIDLWAQIQSATGQARQTLWNHYSDCAGTNTTRDQANLVALPSIQVAQVDFRQQHAGAVSCLAENNALNENAHYLVSNNCAAPGRRRRALQRGLTGNGPTTCLEALQALDAAVTSRLAKIVQWGEAVRDLSTCPSATGAGPRTYCTGAGVLKAYAYHNWEACLSGGAASTTVLTAPAGSGSRGSSASAKIVVVGLGMLIASFFF